MSKFNENVSSKRSNLAAGNSYSNSPKHELAVMMMSSSMSNDFFYDTDQTRIATIESLVQRLIRSKESEFVAKTMVYARKSANLRSVSHTLGVLLSENDNGSGSVRKAVYNGVNRVDDMTEIVALWDARHPKSMIPNGIRRAFRDILNEERFDAYQLKKYEKKRGRVKLKDIVRLAKPSKGLRQYKQLLESNLPKIKMVHNSITQDVSASEAFVKLAKEKRVGYMETLKMSSKIFNDYVDEEALDLWCRIIGSEALIKKSKVLPFRYLIAYQRLFPASNGIGMEPMNESGMAYLEEKLRANKHARKLFETLEQAFKIATVNSNFAEKGESVAILIDNSGSMTSESMELSLFQHALVIAKSIIDLAGIENTHVYFWSDICEEIRMTEPMSFDWIGKTQAQNRATYVDMPFEKLIEEKIVVDKVLILTDNQMYGYDHMDVDFLTYAEYYRKKVAPNARVMFWDLAGYGVGTPVKINEAYLEISGLSDKLMAVAPKLWNDKDALIKEIEKVELR